MNLSQKLKLFKKLEKIYFFNEKIINKIMPEKEGMKGLIGPRGSFGKIGNVSGGKMPTEQEEIDMHLDSISTILNNDAKIIDEYTRILLNRPPVYLKDSDWSGAQGYS